MNRMTAIALQGVVIFLFAAVLEAQIPPRFKYWGEAVGLFTVSGSAGVEGADHGREAFSLDYRVRHEGSFSVRFDAEKASGGAVPVITPGAYQSVWPLDDSYTIHLHLRTEGLASTKARLVLVDDHERTAQYVIRPADHRRGRWKDGAWYHVVAPFPELSTGGAFDFEAIVGCRVEFDLSPRGQVWFDNIFFASPEHGGLVGVTEKPVAQRMAEAETSRAQRIRAAWEEIIAEPVGHHLNHLFAKFDLGDDLEATNQELLDVLQSEDPKVRSAYGLDDDWHLRITPLLYRLYFNFGSKSTRATAGRLEPDVEKAILALLWERTLHKNDIHQTRQSSWWIAGSENHDVNAKVSNLLSSQIFMNESDFAERVYPDTGAGAGSGFWFHWDEERRHVHGPEGAGPGDGEALPSGKFTPKDHYEAWVGFWFEFLAERARKGLFLEQGAPGYMRFSISYLRDISDYCQDEELRDHARQIIDLVWCEWAQEQLAGKRGGAKTRCKRYDLNDDEMYAGSFFNFGAAGEAEEEWYSQLVSSYRYPEIVWRLALDHQGRGCYAYYARKPGEENYSYWPRPAGTERSMLCDTDSRLVHVSWVTPDYIMGTQMDHPGLVHSHLSIAERWHGVVMGADANAWVGPIAIDNSEDHKWREDGGSTYRAVQHRNVMIVQQARRWMQRNPSWYPSIPWHEKPYGVRFFGEFDEIEEVEGWIFVQRLDAYLAIRPLVMDYDSEGHWYLRSSDGSLYADARKDGTYRWGPKRKFIMLEDKYTPIILEAGRKADYASLKDFQADILDNPLALRKTVVPGWFIVMYKGCHAEAAEIVFNAANEAMSRIGGEWVDYDHPKTYDSPFIQAAYNSGRATVSIDGLRYELDLVSQIPVR